MNSDFPGVLDFVICTSVCNTCSWQSMNKWNDQVLILVIFRFILYSFHFKRNYISQTTARVDDRRTVVFKRITAGFYDQNSLIRITGVAPSLSENAWISRFNSCLHCYYVHWCVVLDVHFNPQLTQAIWTTIQFSWSYQSLENLNISV